MDLLHPLRILLGSTAPPSGFSLGLLHPLRILLGSTAPRCEFYLDLLHPRVNSTWIYCTSCEFYLVLLHHPREWGRRITSKGAPSGLRVRGRARRPPCTPRGWGRCITSKAPCTPANGDRCITSKKGARWGFPGGPRKRGPPRPGPKNAKKNPCVTGIYTRNRPATKIWPNHI